VPGDHRRILIVDEPQITRVTNMDGLELCRRFRAKSRAPIILFKSRCDLARRSLCVLGETSAFSAIKSFSFPVV
jgi:hypothetical protein